MNVAVRTPVVPVATVLRRPSAHTWRRLLEADPMALPSQDPAMAVAAAAGVLAREESRRYRFADGREALLPLVGQGIGPLRRLASLPPAWGFGGLVADGPLGVGHIAAVLGDIRTLPAARVQVRPNPLRGALWAEAATLLRDGPAPVLHRGHAHVVPLRGGVGPSRSTRRMADRATRDGVTVRTARDDDAVEVFLTLLRLSVTRWAHRDGEAVAVAHLRRTVRDPRRRLLALRDALGEGFAVILAEKDGVPLSGAIVLQGRNAHYTRGAMDRDRVGNGGASHLLQLTAVERARTAGCESYHMGESAPGSGLARFKAGVGAVGISYPVLRIERLPLTAVEAAARRTARRVLVRPPTHDRDEARRG